MTSQTKAGKGLWMYPSFLCTDVPGGYAVMRFIRSGMTLVKIGSQLKAERGRKQLGITQTTRPVRSVTAKFVDAKNPLCKGQGNVFQGSLSPKPKAKNK